jgi:RHS repeat-associated protein
VDGTAWTRSEVYVGSKHLATVTSAGVFFIHSDWLGTERMRTAASGLSCETISSNPFGDNVQQSGNCNVSPDFFTGKPRDTESNLDDFGARYFSSQWGRWMSADWTAAPSSVPYATLTNPQSLNLYAYVGNDPVDGQDADGHARYDKSGSGCGIYLSYCAADGFGDGGDTLWQQQEIEGDDCEAFVQAQLLNAGNGNASSDETTPASGSTAQEKKPDASGTIKVDVWAPAPKDYAEVPRIMWSFVLKMWNRMSGRNNPKVTAATDAVGIAALAAPKVADKVPLLGYITAGVSIANDPSKQNIASNGIGLIAPTSAPTLAFIDLFDYVANNSSPGPGKA